MRIYIDDIYEPVFFFEAQVKVISRILVGLKKLCSFILCLRCGSTTLPAGIFILTCPCTAGLNC